jgi:hypothetical protein
MNQIPQSVSTPTYFALQLLRPSETARDLAKVILATAHEMGLQFRRLEALDLLELGALRFFRFRTDLQPADALLEKLFSQGRATVGTSMEGTFLLKTKARCGQIPSSKMHLTARNPRMFRGTQSKFWSQQFVDD